MVHNITEARGALREQYLAQLAHIEKLAMAEPSEPRETYRWRLAKVIVENAGGLTERDVFFAYRDHPEMSRVVRILHNCLVDIDLTKLAGVIGENLQ